MKKPYEYYLEEHKGYWRLRRKGNRAGTSRSYNKADLFDLAKRRGWKILGSEVKP